MMVMYLPVKFEFDWTNRFRVPSPEMEILTDRQTDKRNYTNFERNLAVMEIYVPVRFEFDWTNRFRVRVWKRKCGRTNERAELHQFRQEPSYNSDLSPCQI